MSTQQDPKLPETTNASTENAAPEQAQKTILNSLAFNDSAQRLEYIKAAIDDSDQHPINAQLGQADRRALIVAPTYHAHRGMSMPGTIQDACLIHELLVKQYGYQRGDIRILTDAALGEGYTSAIHPTKDNILKGLDWLVHAPRATDRRFFHFSGHGRSIAVQPENGKRMKHLGVLGPEAGPGDTERFLPKYNESYTPERTTEQTVPASELGYYGEVLVAGPSIEFVSDQKLNEKLSELLPGCHLVCTLDCCHSARMMNNAIKLEGLGFINDMIQAPPVAQAVIPTETRFEELPQRELDQDRIRAEAITWGACHQRQNAGDSNFGGGKFTRALVETLNSDVAETLTVKGLYDQVEVHVRENSPYNPQYVQVRMSSQDHSDGHRDEVRNERIAFWLRG